MAEIKVENLSHRYGTGTPFEKTAIEDINLTIPQGQFVGIIGHTGSGKSTLMQHLNALLQPTEGTIYHDGEDINKSKESRRDIKTKVGLVFQYPEYQLFEETVYKDIAFGPMNMGLKGDDIDQRVKEAAAFTAVDCYLDRSPLELSGGQKRRVAIAGVIAMRPEVLILDEPTAGLDPRGCKEILGNITHYHEMSGATIIIVSHNMDDVAKLADRIIVLSKGKVAMDGKPDEIFNDPARLREIGLDIPKTTELAMLLNLKGSIYTHDQLLQAILALKEGKKC